MISALKTYLSEIDELEYVFNTHFIKFYIDSIIQSFELFLPFYQLINIIYVQITGEKINHRKSATSSVDTLLLKLDLPFLVTEEQEEELCKFKDLLEKLPVPKYIYTNALEIKSIFKNTKLKDVLTEKHNIVINEKKLKNEIFKLGGKSSEQKVIIQKNFYKEFPELSKLFKKLFKSRKRIYPLALTETITTGFLAQLHSSFDRFLQKLFKAYLQKRYTTKQNDIDILAKKYSKKLVNQSEKDKPKYFKEHFSIEEHYLDYWEHIAESRYRRNSLVHHQGKIIKESYLNQIDVKLIKRYFNTEDKISDHHSLFPGPDYIYKLLNCFRIFSINFVIGMGFKNKLFLKKDIKKIILKEVKNARKDSKLIFIEKLYNISCSHLDENFTKKIDSYRIK